MPKIKTGNVCQDKPMVKVVFSGGEGLKDAVRLLAKKVLEEMERREQRMLYFIILLQNCESRQR